MGKQIAACIGTGAKDVVIAWVKEQGYTKDDVKILQSGETVWVEKRT